MHSFAEIESAHQILYGPHIHTYALALLWNFDIDLSKLRYSTAEQCLGIMYKITFHTYLKVNVVFKVFRETACCSIPPCQA